MHGAISFSPVQHRTAPVRERERDYTCLFVCLFAQRLSHAYYVLLMVVGRLLLNTNWFAIVAQRKRQIKKVQQFTICAGCTAPPNGRSSENKDRPDCDPYSQIINQSSTAQMHHTANEVGT